MREIHCFGFFFVLIICIWQLKAEGNGNTTIDFGKLEMNIKLLEGKKSIRIFGEVLYLLDNFCTTKGARWAIDQLNENDKIDVYYAVEIVDISKVDVDTMSVR